VVFPDLSIPLIVGEPLLGKDAVLNVGLGVGVEVVGFCDVLP